LQPCLVAFGLVYGRTLLARPWECQPYSTRKCSSRCKEQPLTSGNRASIVAAIFLPIRKMKSLRRILLPLFLLFYFASSFAATHYRAAEASRRILHAAVAAGDIELSDSSESSRDAYPRFREAKKKAGLDSDFGFPVLFDLSPRAITREFAVSASAWEIHHVARALRDRAPPSRV
jgi:hypothetical protein